MVIRKGTKMDMIKFKPLNQFATLPSYKHEGDAGMDVASVECVIIPPHGRAKIPTGLACEMPQGYEMQVRPRSGLSSRGIVAMFGTVDNGYRGEIGVTVMNFTDEPYVIGVGDRIAQLVVAPITRLRPSWGKVSSDTERGEGGFGSTGK